MTAELLHDACRDAWAESNSLKMLPVGSPADRRKARAHLMRIKNSLSEAQRQVQEELAALRAEEEADDLG